MDKEFIPYEKALALKELGFDEECFGYYNGLGNYIINETMRNSNCNKPGMHGKYCAAPTYSQAFRWFRDEFNKSHIWMMYQMETKGLLDYEEAELACLEKLIEIVEDN